jgi:drug/metabolite transporter (DMT)-like permease
MSLETVFAAFGGWLLMDESMNLRGLLGCGLMLTGMMVSQVWGLKFRRSGSGGL